MIDENLTATQKMRKARTKLILEDPFYGALSMRMKMRPFNPRSYLEASICRRSCAIDGKQIVYDPAWIDELTLMECKGLLAHEISHVALKHTLRRGKRDPRLWNSAGDHVIDPILKKAGFELPLVDSTGLHGHFDFELSGKSVEQAYEILKDRRKKEAEEKRKEFEKQALEKEKLEKSGSGGDTPDDEPAPSEDESNETKAPGPEEQVTKKIIGTQLPPEQDEGLPEDEGLREDDLPEEDLPEGVEIFNMPGEGVVLDAPINMKDNTTVDKADEELTIAIEQAYKAAKMHGNMPGELERLIIEQKEHKIDWREELRDFMEKSLDRNDYAWMPPSRRYLGHGLILPGLSEDVTLPNIVVVCDTSGSVSKRELEQYAAEISSVLEEFECTFKVIYCDTRVHREQDFSYEDLPIELNAVGGGGTKFKPAFDYIKQEKIDCEAIVFFTDMDAFDWPQVAQCDPKIPVLWLDSYGGIVNKPKFVLPFGKHIRLDMDK